MSVTINIDETQLIDEGMPKYWICPHCGKRQQVGPYKEEELMEYFQTFQHCDKCGYLHHWTLTLTEDFKKAVADMLIRGKHK